MGVSLESDHFVYPPLSSQAQVLLPERLFREFSQRSEQSSSLVPLLLVRRAS